MSDTKRATPPREKRDWRLQDMARHCAESYEKWPQWMKDLAYFAGRDDGTPDS